MTRHMSKTTVKKPARIIRQNAQIRARPDFRPGPEGIRRGRPAGPGPLPLFQAERMAGRVGVDPEPWLGAGREESRPIIGTPPRSTRVPLSSPNITIVCWTPHSGYFPELARQIPAG